MTSRISRAAFVGLGLGGSLASLLWAAWGRQWVRPRAPPARRPARSAWLARPPAYRGLRLSGRRPGDLLGGPLAEPASASRGARPSGSGAAGRCRLDLATRAPGRLGLDRIRRWLRFERQDRLARQLPRAPRRRAPSSRFAGAWPSARRRARRRRRAAERRRFHRLLAADLRCRRGLADGGSSGRWYLCLRGRLRRPRRRRHRCCVARARIRRSRPPLLADLECRSSASRRRVAHQPQRNVDEHVAGARVGAVRCVALDDHRAPVPTG